MTEAIKRPCAGCKTPTYSVADETLCPQCEKDSDFYRRSRKKGDRREFMRSQVAIDRY